MIFYKSSEFNNSIGNMSIYEKTLQIVGLSGSFHLHYYTFLWSWDNIWHDKQDIKKI